MALPKEYFKLNSSKISKVGRNICMFLSNDSKDFYEKTILKVSRKLGCENRSFLDLPVGKIW